MEYVGAMKPAFPMQVTVNINHSSDDCRTSSSVHYFTGCYGLPYPDHNYGAPPPPQSPPRTPVSAPARMQKTAPARWPVHAADTVVAHQESANDESYEGVRASEDESEVDDSVTRCVCEFAHDDGYMICCDQCSVWQHLDCMGIDRNNIPDTFYCERCEPRYVDKKRAIEMQKWKREELLKLALAQGNPTDLKKLGVNARKIMAFKQKHQYKKVKEKLPHKQFRRKSVDIMPKQKKNNNKLKVAKVERTKSVSESENHRNVKFVEADCNEYSPEVRQALQKEKNHRLSDTVDTVLFIKLLAQLRNNAYLYNRAGNKGLVACEKIFANQPIIEYKGRVLLRDQCEKPAVTLKQRNTHVLYYGRVNHLDVCVDASHYGNEARYLRRSCTPNAEVRHVISGERIHFIVYSRADIDMGAEITIPFDFNYRESNCLVECACTLSDCPIVKFIEMVSSSKKENAQPASGAPTPAPATHTRRKSSTSEQTPAKKKRKNTMTSPERNIVVKSVKTPPSQSDHQSDSDATHHNGTHDDLADKRKMTREERKLEAIMRAFENMEKKQGRRKTLTRSEHPVICTKRDDDIAPEFVNDSPDRSLQSPTKSVVSPCEPSGTPSKSVQEAECRDVDVTSIEPKSDSDVEVKSEHASPKSSPRIEVEVEEDYRHFLDAMKHEPTGRTTPKRESDTGTDDGAGGKSPSGFTPVTSQTGGSGSSAGETTPCPTSDAELLHSPPKKKGWRRRSTLTARRNNRVKSMNDMITPAPVSAVAEPVSPPIQEPAFVHKTKKAINESTSQLELTDQDSNSSSVQSRLSPQEEFVEYMPNSRTLSHHLRRSSAGGVRGIDTGSSSYSTKKRWLKQAMTEDPGPMLPPPPTYSPDLAVQSSNGTLINKTNNASTIIDSAPPTPGTGHGSLFTGLVPGNSAVPSSPLASTNSTAATPAFTSNQTGISTTSTIANNLIHGINNSSTGFSTAITIITATATITSSSVGSAQNGSNSTIVTSMSEQSWASDSITPLKKRRLAWLENGSDSRDLTSFSLPVSPLVTPPASQPATPTPTLSSRAPEAPPSAYVSLAQGMPPLFRVATAEAENVSELENSLAAAEALKVPTLEDDLLPNVTKAEPVTVGRTLVPEPSAPCYRPPTPSGPAPDEALVVVPKEEDVEDGEIIEDGKDEHADSRAREPILGQRTPPSQIINEVDTDKLISDIDAKLYDLERQIANREPPPPPPPPPPRPHLTAGLSPVMGMIPLIPLTHSQMVISPLSGRALGLSPQGPLGVPQSPLVTPLPPQSPHVVPLPSLIIPKAKSASLIPSPPVKRKVSLADYRRRRQSTSTKEAPTTGSPPSPGVPVKNKDTVPSVKDLGSLSLAPIPLPVLPEAKPGTTDPPPRKFCEPTLAERIAERSCEHKLQTTLLERPKSLAERLKSEFGLDTSSDD